MANLLPQKHKQGIFSEYRLRLASGGLGLLAVVFIAGIALLVPSFVLTEARHSQHQSQLNSVEETAVATSTEAAKRIIKQTNTRLEIVNSTETNQLQPTRILKLLAETRSDGIAINNISINAEDGESKSEGASRVSIDGVADTRDNLLGFEDSLENRAQVLAVDLPIGTLASQENTAFDMTVTMQSL